MAKQIISGAALFLDGYDVSGDHNAVAYDYGADAVETTVLSSAARVRLPGLKQFSATMAGLWEAGAGKINDEHFNAIAAPGGTVMTLAPKTTGAAEGEPAIFGSLVSTSYAPGGQVGDAFAFAVAMQGSGDLALGTILHNTLRGSTGSGTIMNLGAALSTQRLFASLHVLSIAGGGALTAKVQSAPLIGFGTPTDRITFAAASAVGAQLAAPVSGPVTDAFWRASWTLTGASPSALFVIAFGIQ